MKVYNKLVRDKIPEIITKDNKKAGQKTKAELQKMRVETANEVGYSKESRKLGKNK